jgi:hypothetical protein
MPDTFIEMDFDEWVKTYKPILNQIDPTSSFDMGEGGTMFETYGKEVEFVKEQNDSNIWMYGDGDDGGSYIWSGWGFINRIGYFITEVPCPPNTTIQIQVSVPWFYCENCDAEIEDEGGLISDKFGGFDFDCCPECATPEQLKEIEETNAQI